MSSSVGRLYLQSSHLSSPCSTLDDNNVNVQSQHVPPPSLDIFVRSSIFLFLSRTKILKLMYLPSPRPERRGNEPFKSPSLMGFDKCTHR